MVPIDNQFLAWVAQYKYAIIFPLAAFEGPIMTIIAGFLASVGQLNVGMVYGVVVAADLTGDSALYAMGRFGRTTPWLGWLRRTMGITDERVAALERHYKNHPKKIFFFGKVAHGVGSAVLVAAGVARYSFRTFFLYNLFSTLIKSLVLVVIGFYFGKAYAHINQYLDYGAIVITIVCVILYGAFVRYTSSAILHEDSHPHR